MKIVLQELITKATSYGTGTEGKNNNLQKQLSVKDRINHLSSRRQYHNTILYYSCFLMCTLIITLIVISAVREPSTMTANPRLSFVKIRTRHYSLLSTTQSTKQMIYSLFKCQDQYKVNWQPG